MSNTEKVTLIDSETWGEKISTKAATDIGLQNSDLMIPPTPIIHLYPIENFAPLTPLCSFNSAEALDRSEVLLLALH